MSESVKNKLRALRDRLRERGLRAMRAAMPHPDFLHIANKLLWTASGGRRISRYMAPW